MAKKWLVERLTKSKQSSPQWVALAEALEEFWDSHFFSGLAEFKDSKNLFTANEAHLDYKISEYGDYFDTALPIDQSGKRLSISWQRANIHEKDTIVPFVSALRVNFAGLGVTWEPLYSNIHAPYARDNLFTEQQIQLKQWDLNDFWMTSRGKIAVDLTHLHQLGMSKETFIAIAQREIERLRPSHIVYDGEYFILTINFDYSPLGFDVQRQTIGESGGSMFYRLTASFDERPADVPWLDESPLYVEHVRGINTSQYHFVLGDMSWSLDLFVDIGTHRVPLAGKEGDVLSALQSLSIIERHLALNHDEMPLHSNGVSSVRYPSLTFNMHYVFDAFPSDSVQTDIPLHGQKRTTSKTQAMGYQLGADWSIDLFVLDAPIAGVDGDKLPPFKQHCMQIRTFHTHALANTTAQKRAKHSYRAIAYQSELACYAKTFSLPPFELKQPEGINTNPWLGFDEIPTDYAPLDTPLWN
ncbi:hypothetical protein CGT72_09770 [Vibrio cholerae]|uniref:hypothetical protein n=1 Tax=Vibrio cholerae TaxID=666 RepID=UPI000BA9B6FB|nr:hypothetical protein [Vibrio cholerae]PAS33350.1 hypothetical protein CGT72_09770 [Vibrio cholerae]